jgi:ADP-ribosylation factor GTPase-activating protein 2/3
MGVHISFVKSTVLDKWQSDQLLMMVCGGNAAASSFFKSKGWIDDGNSGGEQGNAKFTSKAALAYRVHLEKEVAKNRERLVDTLNENFGKEISDSAAAAAAPKHNDALDAEIAQLTLKSGDVRPAKPTPSPPPATSSAVVGDDGQPVVEKAKPVRQVIRKVHAPPAESAPSSAAAAVSPAAADGDSLDIDSGNLASLLSTSKAKKSTTSTMRSQLSTKKTTAKSSILAGSGGGSLAGSSRAVPADDEDPFEAAAREAADSAQRVQREKEESAARAAAPAPAAVIKPVVEKKVESGPDPSLAKYSKSTSISSDQYFERDTYSKTDEADRARLNQFSNANAIGSDQYFGNNTDEDGQAYHHSGGDGELADAVAQTVNGIKGLAQGLFRGIQNRYG